MATAETDSSTKRGAFELLMLRRRNEAEQCSVDDISAGVLHDYVDPFLSLAADAEDERSFPSSGVPEALAVARDASRAGHVFVTSKRGAAEFLARGRLAPDGTDPSRLSVRLVLSVMSEAPDEREWCDGGGAADGAAGPFFACVPLPGGAPRCVKLYACCRDTVVFRPRSARESLYAPAASAETGDSAGDAEATAARHAALVEAGERAVLAQLLRQARGEVSGEGTDDLRVRVPLYRAHIIATDDAKTRLAHLAPFADPLIAGATRGDCLLPLAIIIGAVSELAAPDGSLTDSATAERLWRLVEHVCVRALDLPCERWSASELLAGSADVRFASLSSPCVIVHCLKGVSRSASVVAAYVIRQLAPVFVALRELHLPRAGVAHSHDAGTPSSSSAPAATEKRKDTVMFADFLETLRSRRRWISPNVPFAMELFALWNERVGRDPAT